MTEYHFNPTEARKVVKRILLAAEDKKPVEGWLNDVISGDAISKLLLTLACLVATAPTKELLDGALDDCEKALREITAAMREKPLFQFEAEEIDEETSEGKTTN